MILLVVFIIAVGLMWLLKPTSDQPDLNDGEWCSDSACTSGDCDGCEANE